MPWHIEDDNPDCDGFAVVKDDDGTVEGCHDMEAGAQAQIDALYAAEEDSRTLPVREQRTLSLQGVQWAESRDGKGSLTMRGHAAVYDRASLDLGGFTERIAKGAFTKVLDANPDVHALWDHDTARVLARTANKTLELRDDPVGLHFWAKVAPTSYAEDLRILMDRGDVDQASFAFTVARDEWVIDEDENVTRTITEVGELFDVTITAKGAYPQTDASVVTTLRSRLRAEIADGHLPEQAERAIPQQAPAEAEATTTDPEPQVDDLAPGEERTAAPDDQAAGDSSLEEMGRNIRLTFTKEDGSERVVPEPIDRKRLRSHMRTEVELAKRRLLKAERR